MYTIHDFLLLIKRILNNQGIYFYRDVKELWRTKLSKQDLETIKKALDLKET